MYISYSGWKLYRECPRAYHHRYIAKTKMPPENRVNMLYGSAVGTLFESFYNERLWKLPNPRAEMLSRVEPVVDATITRESRTGKIDWADPKVRVFKSREKVVTYTREAVPRGLDSIKLHRLLGPRAEAEVVLDSDVEGHRLGGRADFIIQRMAPHNDLVITDGKGSLHRGKYVDPKQLLWYAMLHVKKFGKIPDKLGFLFWQSEPEHSIDWVLFTQADLDRLQATVLGDLAAIEAGKTLVAVSQDALPMSFQTKPGKNCKLCSYLSVCKDGENYLQPGTSAASLLGDAEDVGLDP